MNLNGGRLLAITVSGLCRDWKTAQALRVMTEKTVRGVMRGEGGCVRQIGGCKFSGGGGREIERLRRVGERIGAKKIGTR